ncbi:MAG: T9SS type A sorting domain-containing protein [Saprospiraceae bacterium]|nr:T9SS type A sorting domain-containing protein [Saprospiraceae bacterium]
MIRTLTSVTLFLFCFFSISSVHAQGCETMVLTYEHYEPCKFRAKYAITADCYNQINVSLDQGEFFNLEANTAEGWIIEQLSPSELLITNSNGVFPNGSGWFMNFSYYIAGGGNPNLILLYDNTCILEGCETILNLDACPPICIDGNVYRECDGQDYLDQPALENWTIQVLDDMGNVLDEQLSGMDGTYQFCDLPPGMYVIKIVIPNGWTPVIPASGQISVFASYPNPTARFGVCPDCSCDLVDLLIQQEASSTDTANYSVSMFSASSFCFESLDIQVLQGTLLSWDIDLPGWTVEEIIPGQLHIQPFYPFILDELLQDLRVQVASTDTVHIEVTTTWKAKQEGKCKKDRKFPSPPKNVNVTCCPAGMQPGPELVTNGAFGVLTPPASDYTYKAAGPLSSGNISIMDQAQAFASNSAWICPGIFNIWDTYLAVDGSTNNTQFAWKETFTTLTPNTDYTFCAWLNNLVKPGKNFNLPLIEMVIQDDIIPANVWTSTPLQLTESPDVWVNQSMNWTSPTPLSASYTIKIRSLDIGQIGNDFAIDQISFRSCMPIPDTCVCNDPVMIITQNGIDYPLPCTKGAPTSVLPCPVSDVVVSGFFGCESVNGNPCTETVVNWDVTGPTNSYQGTTTNFPSVQFAAANISAPGTYQLTLSTLCPGSTDSCVCTTQWIQEVCDTCYCGGFDHLYLRGPQGTPSQPLTCGGPATTLVCPDPGQGFTLTGNFSCEGDSCPTEHLIEWGLTQPDGNTISMSFWDNDPLFGITLLPNYFNQSGVYTLNLTGYCGDDTCHCELTFIVDCPNQCPCDLADILALQQHVDKGFAVSYSNKSCKACFSPLALDKCDSVAWFLTTPNGIPIGTSWGNQTYCYLFPGSGTYTVIMQVTRLKPDGNLCEVFVKSQTVTVSCIVWPDCVTSILKNADFNENPVAGDIAIGGMGAAPGWMAAEGHPTLEEGPFAGNPDEWAMKLTGNYDESDILMTEDVYCLKIKDPKGKNKVEHWGDPHENLSGKHSLIIQLVQADQAAPPYPCEAQKGGCYTIAELEDIPPLEEGDWYTTEIPFDLSDWDATDSCGDGSTGVPVRLAVYVWNPFSAEQCACPLSHTIHVGNFCLDAETVAIEDPKVISGSLQVYPNPTTGQLQVNLPQLAGISNRLEVVDLTGRLLISQVIPVGERSQQVDLSGLSGGLYFLRWTDGIRTLARQRVVKE